MYPRLMIKIARQLRLPGYFVGYEDQWCSGLFSPMPDIDQMSREELLEARAKIEQEIDGLGYRPITGGGGGEASPRPALIARLKDILAAIDQELAGR